MGLLWSETDLISKQNARPVKKPAGVGIFGVLWYRNRLFILAARRSPATIGHWHGGMGFVCHHGPTVIHYWTEKQKQNVPAQQNPMSTWHVYGMATIHKSVFFSAGELFCLEF